MLIILLYISENEMKRAWTLNIAHTMLAQTWVYNVHTTSSHIFENKRELPSEQMVEVIMYIGISTRMLETLIQLTKIEHLIHVCLQN